MKFNNKWTGCGETLLMWVLQRVVYRYYIQTCSMWCL
jgi:hypothetical protein